MNSKKKLVFSKIVFLNIILAIMIVHPLISNVSAGLSYTPNPPIGETNGIINATYIYEIITSDTGSSWMFDWGDGAFSHWIVVKENSTKINHSHSWNTAGNFEVKVRCKGIYGSVSNWSPSLTVEILPIDDFDEDGFSDELELSYGNDPNDPLDYPMDTNNDGVPDETSPDNKFIGDLDDDGDGLSDIYEQHFQSDPKESIDVSEIILSKVTYYLVDTDQDQIFNVLFNPIDESTSKLRYINNQYNLDVDNDGDWDYIYQEGKISDYDQSFEIPWLLILIIVILLVLSVVFVLFKSGILFFYDEEIIIEE